MRKSIKGLSQRGFKLSFDGKWVIFYDKNSRVAFQVTRDSMFDDTGSFFKEGQ